MHLLVAFMLCTAVACWLPSMPIVSQRICHTRSSRRHVSAPTLDDGSSGLKKKKLTSFPRYLEVECWKRPELRGLENVLQSVAEACKQINRIVQRAMTDDVYGTFSDEENIQGEVQQKLDVLCNTIILRAFCGSGRVIHSVASEEEDDPRCCSDVMVSAMSVSCEGSHRVML